jgi:NAD(P)-dependent dehydrogenase (short-subunit alcohol dehydrogenase family)
LKIIVAGSMGLIGRTVTAYLNESHEVVEYDLALGHDLTDEQQVKQLMNVPADALVNLFAMNDHIEGGKGKSRMLAVSLKSVEDYLRVNVVSLFSVCREFARNHEKGAIVNFSSTYGLVSPDPRLYQMGEKHIGYGLSKAAVIQLTRHMAVHLAPNIRVNCIAPGGVKANQGETFIEDYSDRVPMERMMEARELNKIIEYLCSDDSSYVTGATFCVDGGWTAW